MIEITEGKYAQVLTQKLPQVMDPDLNREIDKVSKMRFLRKFFTGSQWVRIQSLQEHTVSGLSSFENLTSHRVFIEHNGRTVS